VYFPLTTKLGTSTFYLSCSHADMNGPEDCTKTEGDEPKMPATSQGWRRGRPARS
jgi:hypothetical protein